ncbi:hypothetical protein A3B87_03110 [Candidatus Kuenenbacteria bacterium RIFCSPHIGHO2_02_FULL_39_13]|uniref:Uncharacterized protein n=1 Tax=Candidatus Kuenenbacteria bacterium RIFCSPHIGHO2_02_FULL_39_13 TaxID=1798561 RepID=A0A1F6FMU0_9BACT|nr:MAG: hypothetical protein A3B87_03110 [Candidatus Kuenenbacteria bacterium RIFCSPHIGHO2_02_FULL_39_13]
MLKKIISTLLYATIFLLPVFFLPVTVFPLAWNKHVLLLVLSFLALILWLINVIKSGELKLNWTKLSSAVLILLAVLAASTIFSGARAYSFWSAISAESSLNFILYIIIFFLVSNVFDQDKDIIKALIFLLISSALVNLLFLIQLFFGSVLPWDFAQAAGFNLIGSVWAMAVYLGGVIAWLIFLLGNSKIFKNKFYQLSGYLALILFLISLIIIDFKPIWLAVALSMIIVIWLKLKEHSPEKDVEFDGVKRIDLKLVYLPAVIFILAAILIVIKLPLAERFHLPNLITLNNQSTHGIALNTFKESFKNFIVGSGPATFEYQYVLHQPESIAQGPFWQTRFSQGKYALGTFLVEFGVLGLIGFLLIIISFLYSAFRTVILAREENDQADHTYIQSAVLIAGFYFLLAWFLYSVDFTLLFASFLILGLWVAAASNKRKEIIFTKSPQQAFFIMLLGIVIIACSVIGLFYSGKKYVGAVDYSQAIKMVMQKDFNVDSAINLLTKASDIDTANDLYLRELSEVYLIKISQIQSSQLLTPEQKQSETQLAVSQLEMVLKKMIEVNPKNSQNWEQAARVYSNLTVLDANAYQLAIGNYLQAKELNPKNPSILFNLANINFNLAKSARGQSQQTDIKEEDKNKLQTFYEQNLNSALENLDVAVKLKNNYTIAYYLRAVIYEFSEQYDLALANYRAVLQLEPGNEEVIEKVKEIQGMGAEEE